jgi:hypothetical protein
MCSGSADERLVFRSGGALSGSLSLCCCCVLDKSERRDGDGEKAGPTATGEEGKA